MAPTRPAQIHYRGRACVAHQSFPQTTPTARHDGQGRSFFQTFIKRRIRMSGKTLIKQMLRSQTLALKLVIAVQLNCYWLAARVIDLHDCVGMYCTSSIDVFCKYRSAATYSCPIDAVFPALSVQMRIVMSGDPFYCGMATVIIIRRSRSFHL